MPRTVIYPTPILVDIVLDIVDRVELVLHLGIISSYVVVT